MGENDHKDNSIIEYHRAEGDTGEQLMQEINLLKLEGSVFCFDPKQQKQRPHKFEVITSTDGPVKIEINPLVGQPSHLSYRILQALVFRMTRQPYPYTGDVPFTWRGLAKDLDRTWSGRTQKEIEKALDQLQATRVTYTFLDKKGNGSFAKFVIIPHFFATIEDGKYVHGLARFERAIVDSINSRHVAYFNLDRLASLDVIGMVMYKRLFFHFSNIWNPAKRMKRSQMMYHKDYEAICREWLGGLKAEQYKSKILQQLGRHLDALFATDLISSYVIEKKKDGAGFKVVFKPGKGFFEDYDAYYVRRERPRRTPADELMDEVTEPILMVAHFHELLGHEHTIHDEQEETKAAAKLINELGLPLVRDLTEYTVEAIRADGYDTRNTRLFNIVNRYRPRWDKDRKRRREFEERQAAIEACPDCNDKGMVIMRNHSGATTAVPCPHDGELLMAYEERENLRRMPN